MKWKCPLPLYCSQCDGMLKSLIFGNIHGGILHFSSLLPPSVADVDLRCCGDDKKTRTSEPIHAFGVPGCLIYAPCMPF